MSNFQPEIIEKVASELMKKAKSIIVSSAVTGFVVVFFIVIILATLASEVSIAGAFLPSLLLGLLGAYMGYANGKSKALSLKVEAQKLLLDIQIEKNTRKG